VFLSTLFTTLIRSLCHVVFLRPLVDRLKALFATSAALDLEPELLARAAERKAELLRQAERYEAEGLPTVAAELRQHAQDNLLQRPLAGVLPAIEHLGSGQLLAQLTGPATDVQGGNGAVAQVPEQASASARRTPRKGG
jgi:hypothetical protein